ncbi:MAG TPA: RHS repeat-associated core domain-containing protein [Pyrinomonadaceae bacterium]|nr:RHS repeat-associated core domain-containing protein [Pyrinomonadaceae bacterium]
MALNSGTRYLTADHLGSTRVVTDAAGVVKERHDYLPFGEEIEARVSGRGDVGQEDYRVGNIRQKFTGKERDVESGLDYFEARYYSSAQGRFLSADPKLLSKNHMVNPQRWNLYVYVNNNPLILIDPDGRDPQGDNGSKTIDVFLTYSLKEVPKGLPRANWDKVVAEAKKAGYTVRIFDQDSISLSKFTNSLKNSAATIIVGHGEGNDPRNTNGKFTTGQYTLGKSFKDGGWLGPNGISPINAPPLVPSDTKPETNASAVGLFTCNASEMTSAFNMTGKDQAIIANDGGKDGVTGLSTLERAAAAFITTFAQTDGDVKRSVDVAQGVIYSDRNRKLAPEFKIPVSNRGDKLIVERPN